MTASSDRLDRLTALLAKLLKSLADGKTFSYSDLAEQIGVSRNTLYYFANQSDRPSSIKADALSLIIRWFEKRDFATQQFSKPQKKLATETRQVLGISPSTSQDSDLLDAFNLSEDEVSRITKTLPNYLIGIRMRGTTEVFQVSLQQFSAGADKTSVEWTMRFLQGNKSVKDRSFRYKRGDQQAVAIRGLATVEDKAITCIGRREDTNTLSLLNIQMSVGSLPTKENILASYSTYSREEAICRKMMLFDSGVSTNKDPFTLSPLLGDLDYSDVVHHFPEASSALQDSLLGYSLKETGIEFHKLNPRAPDDRLDDTRPAGTFAP